MKCIQCGAEMVPWPLALDTSTRSDVTALVMQRQCPTDDDHDGLVDALPVPDGRHWIAWTDDDNSWHVAPACEDLAERWAEDESMHAHLAAVIDTAAMPPTALTFFCEIAGRLPSGMIAQRLLAVIEESGGVGLAAVVREGAILGLTPHLGARGVREAFEFMAKHDESPTIRAMAADRLEPE